nr:hypothetical protein [uncultured Cohaesibacter sp.]
MSWRPLTAEGQAVARLIRSPSVWRIRDFSGQVLGLDMTAALDRCVSILDRDLLRSLFMCAEDAYLVGIQQAQENDKDDET